MSQENVPFDQRVQRGFRAANAAMTPAFAARTLVDSFRIVAAAYIAIKITGIEPYLDAFFKAHNLLLNKTIVAYCILYLLFYVPSRFVIAFLIGLFDLRDEAKPVKSENND